jgi:4-hydroxybenzoate polyprenyltransferase
VSAIGLGCVFVHSSVFLTGSASIRLALVGFFIVYSSYMLDHVADANRFSEPLSSARVAALSKSRVSHLLALLGFVASAVITWLTAGFAALAMLLVFPLGVAMHGTPLLGVVTRGALGYHRIKDIPYAKAFHTASMLALIVPFCALFLGVHEPLLTFLLYAYFCLRCFSNTVACDYKDIERDQAEGVRTIPIALGIPRTTHILLIVDGVSVAMIIAGLAWGGWPGWTAALAIAVCISSVALLYLARTGRDPEFVCNVVLDSEWTVALALACLFWGFELN